MLLEYLHVIKIHDKIHVRKNLTEALKMLKSFQISNFNSINESVFFSMEPVMDLTEHKDFIAQLSENSKLLKVASIYGPNASGKSNILRAIYFVKNFVEGRLSRDFERFRLTQSSTYMPFEFTNDKDNLVKVSIVFSRESKDYWYSFAAEYLEEGPASIKIINEFFAIKETNDNAYSVVFSRDNNIIVAEKILTIIGATKLPISSDMPLLRHLYMTYISIDDNPTIFSLDTELEPVKDLYEEINSIVLLERQYDLSARTFKFNGDVIRKHKDFIIESLHRLDIQITDIEVKEIGLREYQIFCIHTVNNSTYRLRIEQESQGTSLLIFLLARIASRKSKSTIFLIDELDSHLHPKLVREIISLFNSNLNVKNQLIFNSHDMWNMVSDQFRRDQIWFTYRDDQLGTNLICLSDIVNYKGERIRKDAKFSKQYMEGKYGADPFILKGLSWNE